MAAYLLRSHWALVGVLCLGLFTIRPAIAGDDLAHYSLPADSNPTAAQQQWALATTAILSITDGDNARHLATDPNTAAWILKNRWDVEDRSGLLRQLEWLRDKGFRADFAERVAKLNMLTPAEQTQVIEEVGDDYIRYAGTWNAAVGQAGLTGFDYVLYISLCRWGSSVGYLDEATAWRYIMPAARLLQHSFGGWQSLGRNYLIGRNYWDATREEQQAGASLEWSYLNLLKARDSLWRTLPWNTDLGQGVPLPSPGVAETSAHLRLFPHPAGLNCFSLTFFEPTKTDDLQPALSELLGCPVKISRSQVAAGNTELAGDCVHPAAKLQTHLLIRFPLSSLAALLRQRHVTQLFTEIDHATAGASYANLNHAWRRDGFDYHLGLRDLSKDVKPAVVWFGYTRRDLRRSTIVVLGLLFSIVIASVALRRKTNSRDGVDAFRRWSGFRLFLWLAWFLRIVAFGGLSFLRLVEGGEMAWGAFRAAFTFWLFGSALDLAVTLLFRRVLKTSLHWTAPWFHLARQVLLDDLCLLPAFILLLLASDPQRSFTPAAVVLSGLVLLPIQLIALRLRHRIPGSWTAADENGSLYSRVVSLAQQTGREIRRVSIVRSGEPTLRAITMPSAHTIVIPQEFVERLPINVLDALLTRALVQGDLQKSTAPLMALLIFAFAVVLRIACTALTGLAGALPLALALLAAAFLIRRSQRRLVFQADLETAALTREPRPLIAGIMEASRIRNGCPWIKQAECSWLEPTARRRAQRLGDAYGINLAEWETLTFSAPEYVNLNGRQAEPVESLIH